MTDKELLELAAKAAGITGWQSKHGYWNMTDIDGKPVVCCDWPKFDACSGEPLNPTFADAVSSLNWSPLKDDGDAFRLAVKLGIQSCWFQSLGYAIAFLAPPFKGPVEISEYGSDPCAATRRAIVRAAAEIGKAMK